MRSWRQHSGWESGGAEATLVSPEAEGGPASAGAPSLVVEVRGLASRVGDGIAREAFREAAPGGREAFLEVSHEAAPFVEEAPFVGAAPHAGAPRVEVLPAEAPRAGAPHAVGALRDVEVPRGIVAVPLFAESRVVADLATRIEVSLSWGSPVEGEAEGAAGCYGAAGRGSGAALRLGAPCCSMGRIDRNPLLVAESLALAPMPFLSGSALAPRLPHRRPPGGEPIPQVRSR